MSDKYYLNNKSDTEVTIKLTTTRIIKPHSSLPLNFKDVLLFKTMKSERINKPNSIFNLLVLSKIPIEKDSNMIKATETNNIESEVTEKKLNDSEKDETSKEEKSDNSEKDETSKEEKSDNSEEDETSNEEKSDNSEEDEARKSLEAGLSEQFI